MMRTHILLSVFLCLMFIHSSTAQKKVSLPTYDGMTLNGVLTLPDSDEKLPAVILVHGSGPQDSNSTHLFTNQPNNPCIYPDLIGQTSVFFKDVASYYHNRGIGVFRYNKRTTYSGIDEASITVYDFARDVQSAINLLKTYSEIDPERIYLFGHSQGASIAAYTAANTDNAAGIISASGNHTPVDSLYADQVYRIFKDCRDDSTTGAANRDAILNEFLNIRTGTFPENSKFLGAYPAFWRSWINLDDSLIFNYNTADARMLFIQGTSDFNVPEAEYYRHQHSFPDADFRLFNDINHFFNDGHNAATYEDVLAYTSNWILSDNTTNHIQNRTKEDTCFRMSRNIGLFHIMNECNQEAYLSIYSAEGRCFYESKIDSYETLTAKLKSGLNIIKVRSDGHNFTRKIIH